MEIPNLIEKLKDLGFNTYEAKVYLALLKQSPATGYEISKESGVPQARAYDTLKALETSKIVVATAGKPTTYIPISPNELLDRWERNFKGAMDYLRDTLPSLTAETVEPAINIQGLGPVFQNVAEMINHAQSTIFAELWPEDVEKIDPLLQEAHERGVDLRIVGYDNFELPYAEVFQHGQSEALTTALGGRWLLLSTDDSEGIVCWFPDGPDATPQAVYTRNPGLVLLIKEMVVHDMFLLDVEITCKDAMQAAYGENLYKLRHKVFGDGLKIGGH